MNSFFSRFILKKKESSFKVEVTEECLNITSNKINNFKFNEININEYINKLQNTISLLENKVNNLEATIDKINNTINTLTPFDIDRYLMDNCLSISKGELSVK